MPLANHYRVLVVDDDEGIRRLCRRHFDALDVRCDIAADPIAAESHLRARTYHAIISDLRMPKKHGHDFVSELRHNGYRGLIFVATGVIEPRLVSDLIHRGVTDVVAKPVEYKTFCAKVIAMVERGATKDFASHEEPAPDAVKAQLEVTTKGLRKQLDAITESFETTIAGLEKQRDRLEDGYVGSVRILTDLLSVFSQSEGSHSRRVEELAAKIANALGLDRPEVLNIQVASLVHEIGQLSLPDSLRSKAAFKLAPDELMEFRKYPEIGARLLSEVEGAEAVAELVRYHCENYDGSGYPDGVKGESIPLGARIIRIADSIDTHAMYDPKSDSLEGVRNLLHPARGKKYDPRLVDAALGILVDVYDERGREGTQDVRAYELRSGLTIAESVYDKHGRCLIRAGAKLSETMVARIRADAVGKKVKIFLAEQDT